MKPRRMSLLKVWNCHRQRFIFLLPDHRSSGLSLLLVTELSVRKRKLFSPCQHLLSAFDNVTWLEDALVSEAHTCLWLKANSCWLTALYANNRKTLFFFCILEMRILLEQKIPLFTIFISRNRLKVSPPTDARLLCCYCYDGWSEISIYNPRVKPRCFTMMASFPTHGWFLLLHLRYPIQILLENSF